MAGDDRRTVLSREDLPEPCDVGVERRHRELRRDNRIALALKCFDRLGPRRAVGECAVHEDAVRECVHWISSASVRGSGCCRVHPRGTATLCVEASAEYTRFVWNWQRATLAPWRRGYHRSPGSWLRRQCPPA